MNIQRAAKKALKRGCWITRKDESWKMSKIRPTDTPDCCIISSEGVNPSKRWNPYAEDLTAKDWKLTD